MMEDAFSLMLSGAKSRPKPDRKKRTRCWATLRTSDLFSILLHFAEFFVSSRRTTSTERLLRTRVTSSSWSVLIPRIPPFVLLEGEWIPQFQSGCLSEKMIHHSTRPTFQAG